MKSARGLLVLLAAFACSPDEALLPAAPDPPLPAGPPSSPPVQPTQPSGALAWLWVLVIEDSGVCIDRAKATVVRGQGVGKSVEQVTPCGAWDSDGGIVFRDLTPGVALTLRVSAPGYVVQERTVVPLSGPQTALEILPPRIP